MGRGVEGAYNTAVGGLTGDDRFLSDMFGTTKRSLREGVKKDIKSDFGKNAYDIGMGIGDMGAGALAGNAPAILAGNTAGEAQASAIDRGSSVRKSSLYGGAAGALDYVTNKIGLDKAKNLAISSIKSTGIKKFIAQNIAAGTGEAGENIIQDIGQSFLDSLINGENSELNQSYQNKIDKGMSESQAFSETAKEYVAQLGLSGLLGFGMGSTMQAGASLLPKLKGLGGKKNTPDIPNDPTNVVPEVAKAEAKVQEAAAKIQELSQQIPKVEEPQKVNNTLTPEEQAELQAELAEAGFDWSDNKGGIDRALTPDEVQKLQENLAESEANYPGEYPNKTINESAGKNPSLTVMPLEGAELENANARIKELNNTIKAKKTEVDALKKEWDNASKKNKKAAKQKYQASKAELDALQEESKELKLNIDGGTRKAKDVIAKQDAELYNEIYGRKTGVMDHLNYAAKFAGDTPEAKQLAKDIKNTFEEFIQTGDAFSTILAPENVAKVAQLDDLAKANNKEYLRTTFSNIFAGYDPNTDTFDYDNPSIWNKLFENNRIERINDFHNGLAQNNGIDNDGIVPYNEGTKGELTDGTIQTSNGNDGAGSEGILGESNTERSGLEENSGSEPEGWGNLPADSVRRAEQLRSNNSTFTESEIADLSKNGIDTPNFYNANSDPELYYEALETAKASSDNGAAVDSHSVEELNDIINNGGNLYLIDNGLSGYAVEGNGNLTGVFKNSNSDVPAMGSKIALASIKNGAVKGDCFGKTLVNIYSRGGFEPVARMEYGRGYNDAMDAQVDKQLAAGTITKEPDVYVLKKRDDFDYNRTVSEWGDPKVYTQAELDALPLFDDYDEMLAYRDSLIKQPTSEGAFYNVPNSEVPAVTPTEPANVPQNKVPDLTETTPANGEEKIRSFSRRGSQDKTLPDEIRNELKEDTYKVVRNADTEARAEELFDPDNLTQTRSNLEQAVKTLDPAAASLSYKLAKAYIDAGQYDAATDVIELASAGLTRGGQFTQAAKLAMMQNDPMAALNAYKRDLANINQWGKEKYGRKWKKLELSKDDMDMFNSVSKGDKEGLNSVVDQLNKKFGKQVPASLWDKAVAMSKTSMLLNMRTQGRNIIANMAMLPVRSASDRVSALGQNIAHLINKNVKVTQSLTGGTEKQKEIAGKLFDSLKESILGENKMKDSTKSGILSNRQIFNDDFIGRFIDSKTNGGLQKLNEKLGGSANKSTMETLSNFTYWLMGDFGDTPFVKKNFVNRLASYMKAQGINDIDDIPDDAIAIATEESLKATFKDDNAFSNALAGIKKKSGKFGEIALPFVKTPANLAMRGIDYSPAGLINTFRKIKSGAEANQVIDELAKNLTGSAMIYLGYKLRDKGLLSGSYSEDKDEKAWQKQQGMLENAFHLGDNYYTFDWAQPSATPLLLGSVAYDAINNSDNENAEALDVLNSAYKAGTTVANSWISTSPLQSLSDMLGGSEYGDKNGIAGNIMNEVIEFPQRFIPAQLGATARTVDPVIRDTYTNDDSLTGIFKNQLTSLQSKMPELSKKLPASYDTWGNERTRSDTKGEAFFAQNINPGQLGNKNETPLDAEITRLYDATGNNEVFPLSAARSLDLGNDGNIKLTNQQHSDYQKMLGKRSYDFAEEIMNRKEYKSLSDDEKVKMLKSAYDLSNQLAKEKLFNHTSDSNKKLVEAYKTGGTKGAVDYLMNKSKADALDLQYDTYVKKEKEYKGGAEQYARDSKYVEKINKKYNTNYDVDTLKKYGATGLEQHAQDAENAKKTGFVTKDGKANDKAYQKAVEIFGDDKAGIAKYSTLHAKGYKKNAQLIPELKSTSGLTDEQKGKIVMAEHGYDYNDLGNTAKGAYDINGAAGVWTFYVLKQEADTDNNGSIKKAEKQAIMSSSSPYVKMLSKEMRDYLNKAKW